MLGLWFLTRPVSAKILMLSRAFSSTDIQLLGESMFSWVQHSQRDPSKWRKMGVRVFHFEEIGLSQ